MTTIRTAVTAHDFSTARALFRDYIQTPGVAVCATGFEQELATLESFYSTILILEINSVAAGCGAIRPLTAGAYEMKRLYLSPAARGRGLGRTLVQALIDAARQAGAHCIRLDTLPSMTAAIALYRALGFRQIPPYSPSNPPEALCFELMLPA